MLSTLLREKIKDQNLSARTAARKIGTSHTTLLRALRGEVVDLETVRLCSAWLNVRPTELLDSMGAADHSLADQVAVILSRSPKLTEAFKTAMGLISMGQAGPDLIQDIAAYAAYRIGLVEPRSAT